MQLLVAAPFRSCPEISSFCSMPTVWAFKCPLFWTMVKFVIVHCLPRSFLALMPYLPAFLPLPPILQQKALFYCLPEKQPGLKSGIKRQEKRLNTSISAVFQPFSKLCYERADVRRAEFSAMVQWPWTGRAGFPERSIPQSQRRYFRLSLQIRPPLLPTL